jgi:hypothetical protein
LGHEVVTTSAAGKRFDLRTERAFTMQSAGKDLELNVACT